MTEEEKRLEAEALELLDVPLRLPRYLVEHLDAFAVATSALTGGGRDQAARVLLGLGCRAVEEEARRSGTHAPWRPRPSRP